MNNVDKLVNQTAIYTYKKPYNELNHSQKNAILFMLLDKYVGHCDALNNKIDKERQMSHDAPYYLYR